MILWLASYPRSGNTLLRTLLYNTMSLQSYNCEKLHPGRLHSVTTEHAGAIYAPADVGWEDFYQKARESDRLFVIKTHFQPCDDQPVIYVVRDGRLACWSYLDFHRKFEHMPDVTLLDIILGYQIYGNWTTHYRAWSQAPLQRRLILRYEDLVHAGMDKLGEIAAFLNFTGEVKPWINPFSTLQKLDGHFFREGKSTWTRPDGWTDLADDAFRVLHGPLMTELGYMSESDHHAPLATVIGAEKDMFRRFIIKASHDALALAAADRQFQESRRKIESLRGRDKKKSETIQRLRDKLAQIQASPKSLLERLGWKRRKG